MSRPGKFVTFEGIDLSGKSFQALRLKENLEQLSVAVTLLRDPGATAISERVRSILLDKNHLEMMPLTELLLYEAARVQMVQQVILPALDAGHVVLCDRFFDSTTAYQGFGRQIDLEIVMAANRIGSGGLEPDLTFFIDIPLQVAEQRRRLAGREKDRLEAAGHSFQERVRNGYLQLAQEQSRRIVRIDGDRNPELVQQEIFEIFKKRFPGLVTNEVL